MSDPMSDPISDYLRILIFNYIVHPVREYYIRESTDYLSSIEGVRSAHQTLIRARGVDKLVRVLQIQTPQLFGGYVNELRLRIDLNFLIAYGDVSDSGEVSIPPTIEFEILNVDGVGVDTTGVFKFDGVVGDEVWWVCRLSDVIELISDIVISVGVDDVVDLGPHTPSAIFGLSMMSDYTEDVDTNQPQLHQKKMDRSVIELRATISV